jgi:ABC-2 type transport system permease protein
MGRYLAGVAVAAVSYVLVLLVGFVDGAEHALHGPGSVPVVTVSFLLFSLVGVSLAVLVAWLVEDSEIVVGITNVILLVSFFLTGYNGVNYLGVKWFERLRLSSSRKTESSVRPRGIRLDS